ncbi:MAG: hypothetical protein A2W29_00380 [Gemmatimonadetes bacterium RBG_16_66_8]|nr:MAG: hypothetical protein A2W29_00380 [Gemmatimonadetes bacterium RBG_16_66_8]
MVTIMSLWLPIVLSAVLVFVASAVIWMVLPHHKKEWKGLANEEGARAAMKGTAPGLYVVPFAESQEAMKDPAVVKTLEEGPFAYITMVPSGMPQMGGMMARSFVFYVLVAGGVAYLASRTLAPGTEYLQVFRVTGTAAWFAFGFGVIPDSIWFGKPWSSTVKHLADALVYALLLAGTFGWLWPDMM